MQLIRDAPSHGPAPYPALNASSTPFAVRLHLYQHEASNSRCVDPRLARTAAQDAAFEALASGLLLVGVFLCALLNAWSLGYMQPNRHMRRALSCMGVPVAPLVR